MSYKVKIRALALFTIACVLSLCSAPAQNAWDATNAMSADSGASRTDLMPNDSTTNLSAPSGAASSWTAGQMSFGTHDKAVWGAAIGKTGPVSPSQSHWAAGRTSFGYVRQIGGLWVSTKLPNTKTGSSKGATRAGAIGKYMLPSSTYLHLQPLSALLNTPQSSAGSGMFEYHHFAQKSQSVHSNGLRFGAPLSFRPKHQIARGKRYHGLRGHAIGRSGREDSLHTYPLAEPALNWKMDTGSSLNETLGDDLKVDSGGGLH